MVLLTRSACQACCWACEHLWRQCCTERVLSPTLVLSVHAALASDVFYHRPVLWEATGAWARGVRLLVAATLTTYLQVSVSDPGWLTFPGTGGLEDGNPCRCLLCPCEALSAVLCAAARGLRCCQGGRGPGRLVKSRASAGGAAPAGAELQAMDEDEPEDEPEDEELGGESPLDASGPADAEGIQRRRAAAGEDATPMDRLAGGSGPSTAAGGGGASHAGGGEPEAPAPDARRWCKRGGMLQPLRTKHCSDCNRCVRTHDHHCPWIGTCVGENNRVIFWWFLLFQAIELAVFFMEGCRGIALMEPSVVLLLGLIVIAMIFLMIICLLSFHSFLGLANLTTWEHVSWMRITYLKHLPPERGSPFGRSLASNMLAYCCGPFWCPERLKRWAGLRYDEDGGVVWELGEPRAPNCLLLLCADCC